MAKEANETCATEKEMVGNDLDIEGKEQDENIVFRLLRSTRHDFEEFAWRWKNVETILKDECDILLKHLGNLFQYTRDSQKAKEDVFDYKRLHDWVKKNMSDTKLSSLFLKESRIIIGLLSVDNVLENDFLRGFNICDLLKQHELFVVNQLFGPTSKSHWFSIAITKHERETKYCAWESVKEQVLSNDYASCNDGKEQYLGYSRSKPIRSPNGTWIVTCFCGELMTCERLKYDYLYYKCCPCLRREKIDVLTYMSGSLLWICRKCQCTHECYQTDNEYNGVKVEKGQPLGFPASANLKNLRLYLHFIMNDLMYKKGMHRRDVYRRMQNVLDISDEQCHVAMFSWEQCIKVINEFHT
jgi:hypothetical protein